MLSFAYSFARRVSPRRCASAATAFSASARSSGAWLVLPSSARSTVVAAEQALVDEGGEVVERGVADVFGRLEGAAVRENREAREQALLGRREELVAPVDRGPQRLLALGQVARAARQQLEPPAQASLERARRQQLDARGCELDRQRQPVQPPADLLDRGAVELVVLERRQGCAA